MDESCIGWVRPDGIAHGDAAVVARWAITNAEKEFFCKYGIPSTVDPFFEAAIQDSVEATLPSTSHGLLYQLGWDLGRYIGVAKGGVGVYAVNPQPGQQDVFVNSSLIHLVEFLYRVGKIRDQFSQMDDMEIDRSVAMLRVEIEEIDLAAFADEGNWWSLVFEQMEAGLL
ncbi:SUKH-4 family immunity protein [Actinomadura geliboluensis]|uniref:SUKH-4 family immunity protein n=1 Tax=Actinomadura TaxID=1988 RepID=UPI0034202D65